MGARCLARAGYPAFGSVQRGRDKVDALLREPEKARGNQAGQVRVFGWRGLEALASSVERCLGFGVEGKVPIAPQIQEHRLATGPAEAHMIMEVEKRHGRWLRAGVEPPRASFHWSWRPSGK